MVRGRQRLLLAVGLPALLIGGFTAAARRLDGNPVLQTVTVGRFPQDMALDAQRGRAFVLSTQGLSEPAGANALVALQPQVLAGGTVSMLDTATGQRLRVAAVGVDPVSIVVDQRHGHAFVTSQDAGGRLCSGPAVTRGCEPIGTTDVSMLDTMTGNVVRTVTVSPGATGQDGSSSYAGPGALAVDEQAGHVFAVTRTSAPPGLAADVSMLDGASGKLLHQVTLQPSPYMVVVDAHVHRAFVTSFTSNKVWMLDTRTGVLLRTLRVGTAPHPFAAADRWDGHIVLLGSMLGSRSGPRGEIALLDARTGILLHSATLGAGAFFQLAVDSGCGRVYIPDLSGAPRGRVFVLDGRTGKVLRMIALDSIPLNPIVDPRTGHLVVTGYIRTGQPGKLLVIDGAGGHILRSFAIGQEPRMSALDPVTGHVLIATDGKPPTRTSAIDHIIDRVRGLFQHSDGPAPTGPRRTPSPPAEPPSVVTTLDLGR